MAHENEVQSEPNSNFSYFELQEAFEELHKESIRLAQLVISKKKTSALMLYENTNLLKEVEFLKN